MIGILLLLYFTRKGWYACWRLFLLKVQHSTPLLDWDTCIGNFYSELKIVIIFSGEICEKEHSKTQIWPKIEKNYLFLVKERTTAASPVNTDVQHRNAESAAKNYSAFHCLVLEKMKLCCGEPWWSSVTKKLFQKVMKIEGGREFIPISLQKQTRQSIISFTSKLIEMSNAF